MRLTVLGKSPAWSDAGGACSGYLVEQDERALLVDCGNGVFGKLRARRDYRDVEAVVISHLHGDHLLDVVPFSYALTLGPGSNHRERKPSLIAPLGAAQFFERLTGTWDDANLVPDAFEISEYEPSSAHQVAGLTVRTHPVRHFTPTHAIELASDSGRIVFGADGRRSTELIAAASGADVLIVEATLPDPDPAPLEQRGHMSAEEAGEVADEAGVGRLVLTHISDELDLERSRRLASESFAGPVEIAAEGATYEV